jgi:hypothetical protein
MWRVEDGRVAPLRRSHLLGIDVILCGSSTSHLVDTFLQMAFGLTLSIFAGAMLLKLYPYTEFIDNRMATLGMWVLCATYLAGLLIRVQGLLQEGDSITGKDQGFDSASLMVFVVVGAWIVPALAVVGAVVDTFGSAWETLKDSHEGTPVAGVLRDAPLWRRPLLLLGVGIPTTGVSAGRRAPSHSPVGASSTFPAGGGRPAASASVAFGLGPGVSAGGNAPRFSATLVGNMGSASGATTVASLPGATRSPLCGNGSNRLPPQLPALPSPQPQEVRPYAGSRETRIRHVANMAPAVNRPATNSALPHSSQSSTSSAGPQVFVLPQPPPVGQGSSAALHRPTPGPSALPVSLIINPLFSRGRVRRGTDAGAVSVTATPP